jgi:type I restriction enzyme S subunit
LARGIIMEEQIIPDGYKQTELGLIPESWYLTRLSDLVDPSRYIKYGVVQPGRYVPNGCLMLRSQDYSKGWKSTEGMHRINDDLEKLFLNAKLAKGDLVITIVGAGVAQIVEIPEWIEGAVLSRSTARIAVSPELANNKFVYHFMTSEFGRPQVLFNIKEGAQPVVSSIDVGNCLIPCPPINEQTAIANALSDVDALIASIEKLIAKKQVIKIATMQQLLTGKKRLPPFDKYQEGACKSQLKSTKQTELGEIPEDWGVETITSISAIPMQNGLFYEPSRKGKGISLINVGDMYKSAPIDVEKLELFNANKAEIKTFRVSSGDLFFTRSSIVPSGIAFCNIYEAEDIERNVVFDSHLIRVRVNSEIADAKYIYLACLSNLARKFLISSAKTATMTTIDQGAIKNCPILLPSLEEQKLIVQILSDIDFELEGIKKRLAKTQQIKQGMMQELLTGKTRLI